MANFKQGKNKLPDPKDSNAVRNHIREKYENKKYIYSKLKYNSLILNVLNFIFKIDGIKKIQKKIPKKTKNPKKIN
jgi:hypothetical protein